MSGESTPQGDGGRWRDGGAGNLGAAILLLLDEWPMRALQLERPVSERSGAAWAPDAESVRSELSALEDAGMVSIAPVGGRDTASLTRRGVAFVDQNREALGRPWDGLEDAAATPAALLRERAGMLMVAALQIASAGDDAQVAQAEVVVGGAAHALGRILAGDEHTGPTR